MVRDENPRREWQWLSALTISHPRHLYILDILGTAATQTG